MSAAFPADTLGLSNGTKRRTEVNGHQIEGIIEDDLNASTASQSALDNILSQLPHLKLEHSQDLSSRLLAHICLQQQEQNLADFTEGFAAAVDADFKATQPKLMQGFVRLLEGMRIKFSEQAFESTSSRTGTVTIELPGLPDGVTVTKSVESFFVDEGNLLLERNEARVKLGGLDVYSGYWLAVDSPSTGIEDPLQEEGVDTLRRVMEATGLLSGGVYGDPLEYPFLSALLAPFGPSAALPFEEHLRNLHRECGHKHGGCWFRMTSVRKARSKLEQVTEVEDDIEEEEEEGDGDDDVENVATFANSGRHHMTDAEEADLEIDKLDL